MGEEKKLVHGAGRGEKLIIVDEQDVHHQADDLTRREMITSGFIRQFIETTDEVLEDQPHLLIRHRVGRQIHITELRDDEIEDIRFTHFFDFALELEKIEDSADVGREPFDVTDEMLFDVVRVALQLLERQGRVIVKALASSSVEELVERVIIQFIAFALFMLRKHFRLRRRKHAIKTAQHCHWQHDPLIAADGTDRATGQQSAK